MSLKKSLALASIVLALDGQSAAQDVDYRAPALVTASSNILDFVQPIDEGGEGATVHYRNWGDIARVTVDSPHGMIEAYDDNNDGRIDVIRLQRNTGNEHESVGFYRGRAHLERMIASYVTATAGLENVRIPKTEMGFVKYSSVGIVFLPSGDVSVRGAFRVIDRLYTDILFATASVSQGSQSIPGLRGRYCSDVQRLLSWP